MLLVFGDLNSQRNIFIWESGDFFFYFHTMFVFPLVTIINTVLCPIKVNSNIIELIVPPSCYFVLDLLCVNMKVLKTGF